VKLTISPVRRSSRRRRVSCVPARWSCSQGTLSRDRSVAEPDLQGFSRLRTNQAIAGKGAEGGTKCSVWLVAMAAVVCSCCVYLLVAPAATWQALLAVAASALTDDGSASSRRLADFEALLKHLCIGVASATAVLFVYGLPRGRVFLRYFFSWDALRAQGMRTPGHRPVLVWSCLLGLLIAGTWLAVPWAQFPPVFSKEGGLEILSALMLLGSAGLCAAAAIFRHARRPNSPRFVTAAYALCACTLFVLGMEEVSWGQTWLGFSTPSALRAVNHQQEITVHNLLDRATLDHVTRLVSLLFSLGVLSLTALSFIMPRTFTAMIAPPGALSPLALIIGYSGLRLHPEVVEAQFAVFSLFYSYRLLLAARFASWGPP